MKNVYTELRYFDGIIKAKIIGRINLARIYNPAREELDVGMRREIHDTIMRRVQTRIFRYFR